MSTIKEKFLNLEVMKNCVMFARMSNEEIFNGLKQLQLSDEGRDLIFNDDFEKISNTLNHIKFNFITFVFLPDTLNNGTGDDQYSHTVVSMISFLILLDESIFGYEFNNVMRYCESVNFETNDMTKFILFKFYDEIIVPIVDKCGYTVEMPVLFDKTMDSLEYLSNCNTDRFVEKIKTITADNNIDYSISYIDIFATVLSISYCMICSEFNYMMEKKVEYINSAIAVNGLTLDLIRDQNDTKVAVLLEACTAINKSVQECKDSNEFSLRIIAVMGIFEEIIEYYDKYLHSLNKGRRNKKKTVQKSEEKSLEDATKIVQLFNTSKLKDAESHIKRNNKIF